MKILIACKEFPHSKVIGGPIIIYNRLKYLSLNPDLPPVRRVISVHESYYLARLKDFHLHRWGMKKIQEAINLRGLKEYEFEMYKSADKVLTLTSQGKEELLDICPDLDISIVPHGVDVDEFSYSPLENEEKSVVFVGNYLHFPNVDAVVYFHDKIWHRLKSQVPGIKFYIVGQAPPSEVRAFSQDESIIVTGKVEDVKPYLKKGHVFICPVRLGGGFRGKILEAMAIGRPIVSTSLGAEGIPSVHGENILLADDPESFIKCITDITTDSTLYQKIQKNGRKLVEDKYTWARGVEVLEGVLQELMT